MRADEQSHALLLRRGSAGDAKSLDDATAASKTERNLWSVAPASGARRNPGRLRRHKSGYSLLTVLLLLSLLGIAVSGLLFFITQSVHTSASMIERRRVFYACDGMSRQLITFTQAFLAKNTLEDVPESALQADLRARLPALVPPGFAVGAGDLIVPERPLPIPVPVETITNGPFAGLQAKIQTIDIALQAKKTATGAVCRTEQSLSLGRIALFQFFVFADLPLLDIFPPNGESMFLRGRIHTNGRVCIGGNPTSFIDGGDFAVRLDSRVTAVERILQAGHGGCGVGGFGPAGIIGFRAPGEQVPFADERLFRPGLFEPLRVNESSGCTPFGGVCAGGWRSYAIAHWLGRVQDFDHTVPELTLPVSPPAFHTQAGVSADGNLVLQRMTIGPTRPSTRFLVEPQLTNDPTGFGKNKMAFKAQIRIIDGVWYVKDPGDSIAEQVDDGPWPGIPIWSDHPGEFRIDASVTTEGVEGAGTGRGAGGAGLEVGQSDIRDDLERRATDNPRLQKALWSKRKTVDGVPPTPRRFSYYAFVDRTQAADDASGARTLQPRGAGLQYGRVCPSVVDPDTGSRFAGPCDADPPAVISYGVVSPVPLTGTQNYWQPGFRFLTQDPTGRKPKFRHTVGQAGWCGGRTDFGVNEVRDNQTSSAALAPARGVDDDGNILFSDFPVPGSPLPSSTGSSISYQGSIAQSSALGAAKVCTNDSDDDMRRRARMALLEGTRAGFVDTNMRGDSSLRPDAQPRILPVNFDVHAFQEALADRTPGELGSYFCRGCLWDSFDGSIFISNTWRGSMLGAARFPDGESSAPPNPQTNSDGNQPRAVHEDVSTTAPLPYPLCTAASDESTTALAQLVNNRFLDADEQPGAPGGFNVPYAGDTIHRDQFDKVRTGGNRPRNPLTLSTPEDSTSGMPSDLTNALVDYKGSYVIPNCTQYALAGPGPLASVRPTAVRVINARVINFNEAKCGFRGNEACVPRLSTQAESRLPDGMNLITNVPLYVVGDVNQTSEVNNVQTGTKATDWVPFMVAADTITTLSNGWDDDGSRWGVGTDDNVLVPPTSLDIRPALATRYHMLLLTGINAAGGFVGPTGNGGIATFNNSGGGLPNSMRLMENWASNNATHVFRGAIVLGWSPIYTHWKVAPVARGTYIPPRLRDWQFDRHLNATINQPPDSPVFDVSAIRSWRRE